MADVSITDLNTLPQKTRDAYYTGVTTGRLAVTGGVLAIAGGILAMTALPVVAAVIAGAGACGFVIGAAIDARAWRNKFAQDDVIATEIEKGDFENMQDVTAGFLMKKGFNAGIKASAILTGILPVLPVAAAAFALSAIATSFSRKKIKDDHRVSGGNIATHPSPQPAAISSARYEYNVASTLLSESAAVSVDVRAKTAKRRP